MKAMVCKVVLVFLLVKLPLCEGAFQRQNVQRLPRFSAAERLPVAICYNPALIGLIDTPALRGEYTDLFNLKFLRRQSGIVGFPSALGKFGLGIVQFGDEHYREQTLSILYGFKLTGAARLGIGLHEYRLTIPHYGKAGTFGVDVGAHWQVSPQWEWELAYANINQAQLQSSGELLPQQIYGAMQYTPFRTLTGHAYLIQELGFPIRYGVGTAYRPFPWMDIAIDFITDPLRGSVGLNLHWRIVHLEYMVSSHSVLPLTHRFGLLVTF